MDEIDVEIGLTQREFLEILASSKLLDEPQFAKVQALSVAGQGKSLASAAVKQQLLTHYQVTELLNRRTNRLRIGNYDLLDKLGTGGTGTVFKARHRRMNRIVAIKILARNLCKDPTFVSRFQREVETIAQLSHPNIVMAHDADESSLGHFLVMEFVDGTDLASVVQKKGRLPLTDAVDAILQSARGMAYVHQKQMIHRDIKPANLLRDALGTVKVTDLGLARFAAGTGGALAKSGLTQAGGLLGTVDYMSPEQALDATKLDSRTDIYSLGATLYFLLVGHPPYPGQTMMDTLLKHRDAPIPSSAAHRAEVPAALDELCRHMLAKTVKARCPSMDEVAKQLQAIQSTLSPPASDSSATATLSASETNMIPVVAPRVPRVPRVPRETISGSVSSNDLIGETTAPIASPNENVCVLVVERSRTQAGIIRKFLQSQNISKVTLTTSGQETLAALRQQPVSAVVCPMYLDDMTGLQLAKEIRSDASYSNPGFVLITSQGESEKIGVLTTTTQTISLAKPFTPEQLLEALSVVTRKTLAVVPTNIEQMGLSIVKSMVVNLPPPKSAAKFSKLRVLVIDDSKTARTHILNILAGLGVTHCVEANDGAQAVAMLSRDNFDLIVTDYNLPFMDGRNLIAYVKSNAATAAIPIMMVTSETEPKKLQAVRDLGVNTICEKSFPTTVVRAFLDAIVKD